MRAVALREQMRAYAVLGTIHAGSGRLAEEERAYRLSLEARERLAAEFPDVREGRDPPGDVLNWLDMVLERTGRIREAERSYRQALALYEKLAAEMPESHYVRLALSDIHLNLGNLHRGEGRPAEAERAYREAEEILEPFLTEFPSTPSYRERLANVYNGQSWLLATAPDPQVRDPALAVALAKKAVELTPRDGGSWNTLGVARYRAGDWKAAIAALGKSMELLQGRQESFNAFFLAMARWRLGEKDEARRWYDRAVAWMDENRPRDAELRRFRAEAAALMGLKDEPMPEGAGGPPRKVEGSKKTP